MHAIPYQAKVNTSHINSQEVQDRQEDKLEVVRQLRLANLQIFIEARHINLNFDR
jgi:hypothetical protein